mgnify:CR=1 FL=1
MVETCGTPAFYNVVEDCLKQPRMKARAKECFMWWMFRRRDAESKQYVDAISSLMEARYPKTLRIRSMYAGDHLAQLLQKRESMIMIDGALATLINSGIFAVSVHDSFLVRKEDSEFVKETIAARSEEHTSELQSRRNLVCRLLLEKKKKQLNTRIVVQLST